MGHRRRHAPLWARLATAHQSVRRMFEWSAEGVVFVHGRGEEGGAEPVRRRFGSALSVARAWLMIYVVSTCFHVLCILVLSCLVCPSPLICIKIFAEVIIYIFA